MKGGEGERGPGHPSRVTAPWSYVSLCTRFDLGYIHLGKFVSQTSKPSLKFVFEKCGNIKHTFKAWCRKAVINPHTIFYLHALVKALNRNDCKNHLTMIYDFFGGGILI